ncbi:hypothetical protein WME76_21675 [Sorangium sp. So ce119]|uniref:hypothetical protein n=1 Tax=Sorangium sp. So ce119 TaxID=3133279 RepID=UPI003F5EA2C2
MQTIEQAYEQGQIRFPFWAHPIPKFIAGTGGGVTAASLSFVATLAQPFNSEPAGCDGQPNYGGCHTDGMNRGDNDLRGWLEEGGARLPKGEHGVDSWIDDEATVAQVKELYPPSTVMCERMESDRKVFLAAMAKIKREVILGTDKNVYVEPTIWTIEWAQKFYKYAPTRSN